MGLRHLQLHGVLGTKEPCHSPFAYLSRAGNDVILLAKFDAARQQAQKIAADRQRQRQEREATEDRVHRLAIEKFRSTFTTAEQNERIDAYLAAKYPSSTFRLPRPIILGLVAREWWDECGSGGTGGIQT